MNLNRFLFITISILSFAITHSQTTKKKNQLEFSIGYNSGSLKNLELAPVAQYDYNGLVYKLNYERTSKKQNIFEVELNFLEKTALKTDRLSNFNTERNGLTNELNEKNELISKLETEIKT